MRKLVCVLSLLFMCVLHVAAQDKTVTGKVIDEKDGSPLAGVSVTVKGSNTGTTTNADGSFRLSIPASAKTLVFSYVNYANVEIAVGNRSSFNISLSSTDKNLQEVVVVGYQQRKKRDEGGAISSVKGKEIANLPNASVDRALQGRAPGVLVQATNGIPGGAINVRIRGTGSYLAGNDPLYIVDGVQINTRTDGNFTQNNPLAFLNPNDIESIDVLKDAASAAIYGAQASNGVVIITTKKGKAGKTKFNFNAYYGTTKPIKKFDVLNTQEYINARAEAFFNANRNTTAGYTLLNGQQAALGELSNATGVSGTTVGAFSQKQVDSMVSALPSFDWQDLALQNGVVQNYDMNMSGGNDKTTFYLGAAYSFQSTIINKVDFKRYALNADITHKVNDKLSLTSKFNISSFEQQLPFGTSGSFLGSPIFSASLILPVNRVRNADGTYFGLPGNGQALAGVLNQNVIAVNEFNTGYQRTNQLVGSITADYKITPWLSFRSFYGLDYRLVQGNLYRDPRTNDGFGVRGRGTVESDWNTNFLTTQTLNFNKSFGKNRMDGLLGVEYRRDIRESIGAAGIGFPSFQFVTIDAAATAESVSQFWTGYKRAGYFGRLNYSYDNRYSLSFILRRDGSSRFGNNFTFGWFPGVIASWNMDNEKFMQNAKWISTLRLRGSWGQTGNDQIGNFDSRSLFGAGSQYNQAAAINYTQLGNPDIRWERNQTTNIGVDYGFFNNRISGSLEVYERLTKGLLLPRPITWQNGVGSFTQNVGVLQLRGVELGLNVEVFRPKTSDGFRWNVVFNYAFNYNNVKSLYDGLQQLPGDPSLRVGRSLNSVFTQVYAGVNPATGRPQWVDTFGNRTYTPQLRDRRYIGDSEADHWGGLTNTFSFKGFTLDVLFTYQYGVLTTDGQVNFMLENANRTFNTLQFAYDQRWKQPGDITAYPRAFNNGAEPGGVNHVSGSDRLWKRADFIRMRDARLSYDFSQGVLRKLKLNSFRLYVQGQNLFTYSDWWGYDPEFTGTSTGIIPQTKNYNFGIQIGF
ncbi:MAG: SusC/RagA family TonB-linked outer membrane protein [Chitinophagaceae bacterium]|jgi:TonB-linked SusC/RagA family outer membrane protein